jgi:hypothetical protein
MNAERLAQLRSLACYSRPATLASQNRSGRDWKAPAAAWREYSHCAEGSTSPMIGELRTRTSSGHRLEAAPCNVSQRLWRRRRLGP